MNEIRLLSVADVNDFRNLRLKSLVDDPLAWHSSLAEEKDKPLNFFSNKITYSTLSPVFGYYGFFDNNQLVGYAQLADSYYNKKRHIATLYDVLVDKNSRGTGIGKKLIGFILEKAKSVGFIEQIHLKVNSKNTDAIGFYEKLGFNKIATIPDSVKEPDGSYQDEYEYVLHI